MNHPIQPIYQDENDRPRFKRNAIVAYLLDNGPFDMNHLARQDFSSEDREQFAQLIGYSLSGYSELSYVSDKSYETARRIHETGQTEEQARNDYLETTLRKVQNALKSIVPHLFKIHPDDLIV